ncbi:MAG: hypothetical protein AAB511_03775 [Patescibacteria group bacterium]
MKKFLISISSFLPVFALAQGTPPVVVTGNLTTISQVLNRLEAVISLIIPFLVGVAVLIIIYGIISFIANAADEEARANAKHFIIWGVIGVFFMLSIWGLVTIMVNSFGTDEAGSRTQAAEAGNYIPTTPTTSF